MNPLQKVKKAQRLLLQKNILYGALSLRLEMVIDPTCKTAWTDGRKMGVNPAFFDDLGELEQIGLIAHEVAHCALLHFSRRDLRDPFRWNMACDCVINDILLSEGFRLPDGALCGKGWSKISSEEAYRLLEDEQSQNKGGSSQGQPQPSNGQQGQGQPQPGQGQPQQGQGQPQPGQGQPDEWNFGEIREGTAADDASLAELEQEWKVAVTQTLKQFEGHPVAGKGTSTMLRTVLNTERRAVVDWRTELEEFLLKTSRDDYDWTRPSRRGSEDGFITPSLYSKSLGNVVLVIDTSGSTEPFIPDFAAELNSLLSKVRGKITVLYADTKVTKQEEVSTDDLPVVLNGKFGGGTKFSPTFRYIEQEGLEVDALVYLTDLICNDYGPAPHYPVLWVEANHKYSRKEPPFGRVTKMI